MFVKIYPFPGLPHLPRPDFFNKREVYLNNFFINLMAKNTETKIEIYTDSNNTGF